MSRLLLVFFSSLICIFIFRLCSQIKNELFSIFIYKYVVCWSIKLFCAICQIFYGVECWYSGYFFKKKSFLRIKTNATHCFCYRKKFLWLIYFPYHKTQTFYLTPNETNVLYFQNLKGSRDTLIPKWHQQTIERIRKTKRRVLP